MYSIVALRRALKRLPAGYKVRQNIFGGLSIYDRANKYKGFIDHATCEVRGGVQPMSKYHKRLAKLLAILAVVIVANLLQGCSFVKYTGEKSSLVGIELGTKTALQGLVHHRDSENFDLTIDAYDKDASAEALVGAAVKAAIEAGK